MSLQEASEAGDRLEELKAMRRIIVTHISAENTLARDLAALTRQVREMSKEIESLEARAAEERSEVDSGNGASDEAWEPQAI